jgi:hypothetical protein
MQDERRDPPGSGLTSLLGDEFNQHPVLIAFLDKLNSLSRIQRLGPGQGDWDQDAADRITNAHQACEDLAAGKDIEWEVTPL